MTDLTTMVRIVFGFSSIRNAFAMRMLRFKCETSLKLHVQGQLIINDECPLGRPQLAVQDMVEGGSNNEAIGWPKFSCHV